MLGALVSLGLAFGGAVWDFDAASYRPGETATAVTAISWGNGLGTPAEGPYFAYVIASDELLANPGDRWPSIPPGAVPVGVVEAREGPLVEDGLLTGPNHARLQFAVPDLPPGRYDLLHCNDPCTTTLGDITWGRFTIAGEQQAPGMSAVLATIRKAVALLVVLLGF